MSNVINEITINFREGGFKDITLFTGRKNGKKAKEAFRVLPAEKFIFIADESQVITSSFFLGLIGDELTSMLAKAGDINTLLTMVDLSALNEVSRNECIRAIKRGIISNDIYL